MLIQANVETTPVSPDDLVDGETVYYTIRRDPLGHGPFTVRIIEGITHLENQQSVCLPLSKFGNIIHLCRINTTCGLSSG